MFAYGGDVLSHGTTELTTVLESWNDSVLDPAAPPDGDPVHQVVLSDQPRWPDCSPGFQHQPHSARGLHQSRADCGHVREPHQQHQFISRPPAGPDSAQPRHTDRPQPGR